MIWWILGALTAVVLVIVLGQVVRDRRQTSRAVLRNFPVVGHLRYMLEGIGPELRQYIVTSNDEERPFSRDERRWVYASAKGENNTFGFGTDNAVDRIPGYLIVRHRAFPLEALPGEPHVASPDFIVPCAKVLGGSHGRPGAFRPSSIVNVSGMSFGALSGRAIEALDRGAAEAHCLHNTGEGGISDHHRQGADLIMQIGTAYFGCRDEHGRFSMERLVEAVGSAPVKALEVKLSQGAKPGLGGLLPAAKVTPTIAAARGIPMGVDCKSPSTHAEFDGVDSLIEFVESLAATTGLPVGIKSAVGDARFFTQLAERMEATGGGPDFITVDGGEGGTGAAPLVFADHVSLPFLRGFPEVYRAFAEAGISDDVVFVGSGRLGLPHRGLAAMSLGCDMLAVARETMLTVGCIQAQRCHTGNCPTGVATQRPNRERGLVVSDKAPKVARYLATLRQELLWLAHACGEPHPGWVATDQVAVLIDPGITVDLTELAGYEDSSWGLPSVMHRKELADDWAPMGAWSTGG